MFGHHPRIWALTAGLFALIGTYGVLIGILGSTFWPSRISSSDTVVAFPLALLVAYALGSVVRYHLSEGLGRLPAAEVQDKTAAFPRQIRFAFYILFAYVGLIVGEGLTVLLYGNAGPFSHAFTGIASHAPLVPVWTWPLAFAAGAGLMHWICWAAIIEMRQRAVGRTTDRSASQAR